jgi:hypothetical protein
MRRPYRRGLRVLVAAAVLAGVFAATAAALRFSDASYFTPEGIVGSPYVHRFEGVGGCGPSLPYRFTVINGDIPPGLALAADGLLSGTPTTPGSFSFWVNLSDENPPSREWCRPGSSQRQFTVTVVAAELAVTTRRLPEGKVGKPFSFRLQVSGGVAPFRWRITDGSLPTGLALAPSTGAVRGRPRQGGRFRLGVEAVDRLGTPAAATVLLVVTKMEVTTRTLPRGVAGRAYRARLATRGGVGPVRWRIVGGALPRGLRLVSGAVTGRPRTPGAFSVTVRARDRYGDVSTRRLRLVVRGDLSGRRTGV